MAFPIDWDEWITEWRQWVAKNPLPRSVAKFPPKNFLADDVVGVFRVNGRDVELSEVTMPDFSRGYGADRYRYVGITFMNADGSLESGDLVDSWDALGEALGMVNA